MTDHKLTEDSGFWLGVNHSIVEKLQTRWLIHISLKQNSKMMSTASVEETDMCMMHL